MGSYLQSYGAGDEERIRLIKRIVIIFAAVVVLAIVAYFLLKDYTEKSKAKEFLALVNSHRYEQAYQIWGCTPATPCRDYSYQNFLDDWGPKKANSPWKIASTDSCRDFYTVDVEHVGSDLQSIMVARNSPHVMGFAPSPECNEREWRWGQFFHRLFGGGRA
ncbi:MAG: hypothetical protein WA324_16925 [Bryobacteraceae bacterium]